MFRCVGARGFIFVFLLSERDVHGADTSVDDASCLSGIFLLFCDSALTELIFLSHTVFLGLVQDMGTYQIQSCEN